ncbi:MAG: hypothetical protein ABW185_26020 [Sedimenticola sp.]
MPVRLYYGSATDRHGVTTNDHGSSRSAPVVPRIQHGASTVSHGADDQGSSRTAPAALRCCHGRSGATTVSLRRVTDHPGPPRTATVRPGRIVLG